MKIVLINHYAGSPEHGMEFRPYFMARRWAALGHQVTILAASHSHLRSKQPTVTETLVEEDLDGVRYLWLRTPKYEGNGAKRAFNIFAFVARAFSMSHKLARELKPDAVIASSTYPLDAIVARRMARLARARFIFEVHDLWPMSPMELGGMAPKHPFIQLMQWAENYAYRTCDAVVSMLPLAEDHMREHGLAAGKFHYVPNGIVASDWVPECGTLPDEHADCIRELRAQRRFLIAYAGSHGIANALETLIEAAALLRNEPVSFLFIGQGPEKAVLQSRAADLVNVRFLQPVPRAAIPELLTSMDALAISWRRCSLYRFGISPNKLMDYMMAARPVIQAIDAGNDMVREAGCGISVPAGNAAAFVEAARVLMRSSNEERQAMGQRGREYVLRNNEYDVLARRFLEVLSA